MCVDSDPEDEDILEPVQETTYVPDKGEEYLGQVSQATVDRHMANFTTLNILDTLKTYNQLP